MVSFVHEDGQGNMMHEDGTDVVMMESDCHLYPVEAITDYDQYMDPVEAITDYDQYMDMKPPEPVISKIPKGDIDENAATTTTTTTTRKTYRCYKDEEKEELFFLVYEKGMSVRAAALQLQIKPRTAQYWVQQDQKDPQDNITKKSGGGRPPGRPPKLIDEHKEFLLDLIDEKPSLVLDEIMESLTEKFADLDIKKSALHDFMTNKCKISLKRAHFHSIERNSPEKIEARYEWVAKWLQTDMDYLSNCVFVDEAAFHINMKRSYAWSKKGSRAVVKVPKTRALTTTILGAISPFGVVNVSVRRPKALAPSKKRKTAGSSQTMGKASSKRGTVTGHYFNFLSSTMDVLDRHEEFKGNYIVMDNAPIHQHDDIRKHIENRGYRCLYLPAYSPELNPIEQFWSVCKSKLKREQLLEEETLTTRIQMACNQVLVSDLKGFCKYSVARFDDCLNRKPI